MSIGRAPDLSEPWHFYGTGRKVSEERLYFQKRHLSGTASMNARRYYAVAFIGVGAIGLASCRHYFAAHPQPNDNARKLRRFIRKGQSPL
jgi:hypothetical protein